LLFLARLTYVHCFITFYQLSSIIKQDQSYAANKARGHSRVEVECVVKRSR
jgi:hypothetical protein